MDIDDSSNCTGHCGPDIDNVELKIAYTYINPIDEDSQEVIDEIDETIDDAIDDIDFEEEYTFDDSWYEESMFGMKMSILGKMIFILKKNMILLGMRK